MEQVVGPAVGRYEIVRPIGEGGMAQVYLCVRRGAGGFEKRVVMKVLHSRFLGDQQYVQMFLDEARLLARIQHPNVVNVFEVECVDGIPYLAMEYVNGPTLGRLHKRAARSGLDELGYFLHIVQQTCIGLHHAHGLRINGAPAGLVHRDVSSQNILVDAETGMAKLIDFGIAKIDEGQQQTQVGVLKGKIHYMAPEVLHGVRPDARADLYAVGVLLYRLVTDRLPFGEGDDIWAARISGRYPKASEVKSGVTPQMDAIIDRALQPDPAARYQTAAEISVDLQREIERLRVDVSQVPAWIAQVFPGGEDEWSKRYEPGSLSVSTMHSTLSQLITEGGSKTSPPRLTNPGERNGAIAGGLAAMVVGLVFSGVLWFAWPNSAPSVSPPSEDASTYLDAADDLLDRNQFDAALAMNARADALGVTDASLIVRMARQKNDIEHERALGHARAQVRAGRLDEARETLSAAMALNPSDEDLAVMFAEIDGLAHPPTPPPAAAPVVQIVPAPPPKTPARRTTAPKRAPASVVPVPDAVATGVVEVTTVPPGLVSFDGALVGESPITITDVVPGLHTVEARLDGYGFQRVTLTVDEAKTAPVQIVLQPDAPTPLVAPVAAAPAPTPVVPNPTPTLEVPKPPPVKNIELPAPSEVATAYALHAALASVQEALTGSGVDAALAKSVLLDLEVATAPRFEAGQSLRINPRAIYDFVLQQVRSGVEKRDLEANLRKAFRVGALD